MSWIKNPGTDPSRSCVARLGQSRFLEFPRQQPIIVEIQGTGDLVARNAEFGNKNIRRFSRPCGKDARGADLLRGALRVRRLCVGMVLKSNHEGTEERRMPRGRSAVSGRNLPQCRIFGCSVRPRAGPLDILRRAGSGATVARPEGPFLVNLVDPVKDSVSPPLHPFGGHAMMDALSGTAQGSGDSAPRGGTILSAGFSG